MQLLCEENKNVTKEDDFVLKIPFKTFCESVGLNSNEMINKV